ncbi:MAG TPA: MBOAT family O-acyltransferase [Chitinophagales bacterium]|nr:MBOAT family O-acyltransferase [Chitinophagales bacterium]
MVFSSILFLVYFFPLFLVLYFITPVKYKNYTALAASVFFYAWGAPKFIFVVFAVLIVDYYIGNRIYATQGKQKKLYLLLSILLNIGMLFYFKYSNFFVENVNFILGQLGIHAIGWTKIALPIGISFFVFQEMSYTIDIYRGEHKPLKNFGDYMLFIFLFSHLIAGPIVTYHVLADDIVDRRKKLNNDYRLAGLFRFSIGLARKVLIANTLGEVADGIFAQPVANLTAGDCWLGAIAYTFQLYFDFAGYSDMAIGIGKILGFDFPENFNNPYISQNITEFWKRWHITLGQWMRNYLYIPLGGNRVSEPRAYLNLVAVFLISGFWHGASWTFVIWGAYHGFFMICDRLFLDKLLKPTGRFFRTVLTFFIAVFGWVLFRSDTIQQAGYFILKMLRFRSLELHDDVSSRFIAVLALALLFSFAALARPWENLQAKIYSVKQSSLASLGMFAVVVVFYVLCLSQITATRFNPFIYFRF